MEFSLLTLLPFIFLTLPLLLLALQLLQQHLRTAADPCGILQDLACLLIQFLGRFLQLNLRHSTLVPPHYLQRILYCRMRSTRLFPLFPAFSVQNPYLSPRRPLPFVPRLR